MVGSGPIPSGPGPSRLNNIQDPQSRNTPCRRIADADKETRTPIRSGGTVMGGTGSVPSEPGSVANWGNFSPFFWKSGEFLHQLGMVNSPGN